MLNWKLLDESSRDSTRRNNEKQIVYVNWDAFVGGTFVLTNECVRKKNRKQSEIQYELTEHAFCFEGKWVLTCSRTKSDTFLRFPFSAAFFFYSAFIICICFIRFIFIRRCISLYGRVRVVRAPPHCEPHKWRVYANSVTLWSKRKFAEHRFY